LELELDWEVDDDGEAGDVETQTSWRHVSMRWCAIGERVDIGAALGILRISRLELVGIQT
jgi:hypothetical protein